MCKKTSLQNINNFIVYYGYDNEDILSNYDLLILEQKGHSKEQILSLKAQGKVLIAYLSIIEISQTDEIFELLDEDDFLKINGNIVINKEYNTYYLDISLQKVQAILINKAKTLLDSGYHGLFFDTIANIEYLSVSFEEKQKLVDAFVEILKQIKQLYTNAIFIQNNAIESVYDDTSIYLDGICFENPPCKTMKNLLWTLSAFQKLDRLKTKVFVLEENICNNKDRKFNLLYLAFTIFIKSKKYLYYMANQFYK